MARNVRNFWITASVDGRSSRIATGPRTRDGGFDMTIRQRADGQIVTAAEIMGRVRDDGELVLTIRGGGERDYPGIIHVAEREITVRTTR